jgi:hypothetical protein
MYKLFKDPQLGVITYVFNIDTGAFIPFDESNRDYQEYLEWVEAGNEPEPADE